MGRPTKEEVAARQAQEDADLDAKVEERMGARMATLKQELVEQLAAQLAQVRKDTATVGATSDQDAGDRGMIQMLAHEIAKVGDPGNKRRTVSPEVAAAREEAQTRMMSLLLEAHAKSEMPVYTVVNKIYLMEVKIEPQYKEAGTNMIKDTEINWPGIPNEAMRPANEVAGKIHKEFLASIGSNGATPRQKAPWVISGNEIVRGTSQPVKQVSDGQGFDPRVPGKSATPKTINVLGSVAQPALVGP